MAIVAPTPTNVPAQNAVVYDIYWLKSLNIAAGNPANPIVVTGILHKARDAGGGNIELSPIDPDVVVRLNDFAAAAVTWPNLITLEQDILNQISVIAVAQHKI